MTKGILNLYFFMKQPPDGFRFLTGQEQLKSDDGYLRDGQVLKLVPWALGSVGKTVREVNDLWKSQDLPEIDYVREL